MNEEMMEFKTPEELCKWLDINHSDVQIDETEATILFRYLEGHDYQLGFNETGLVRKDIAEENGEIVSYSIDELIDIVCEWNYELIEHATQGMANPKDFVDFCNYKETYDLLKEDEVYLDKMFARTMYAKEVQQYIVNTIVQAGLVPVSMVAEPSQQEQKDNRSDVAEERVR